MCKIKIIVFDEEEVAKTLVESYLNDLTFEYTFEKYSFYDEKIINEYNDFKIIIVDVNKFNMDILKSIELLSKKNENNFVAVSYDESTDLHVKVIRFGVRDILLKPLKKSDFVNSLQKIYNKYYVNYGGNVKPNIFTVDSSEKGGGKTFFMINLAKEIADLTNEKVLLLDFNNDVNDVASMLNVNIVFNTPYIIGKTTRENADAIFNKVAKYKNSSLFVVANGVMRNSVTDLNVSNIPQFLDIAKDYYKYIFIDNDSNNPELSKLVINSSTEVFYLINPASQTLDKVTQTINHKYKERKVSVVLNMYMPKYEQQMDDIQVIIGKEIIWKIPKNMFAATVACNNGTTLGETNKEIDVVKSYNGLAKYIIDRDGQ